MNEFEEIALELRRRKKINMWGIDISLLKDGVYHGTIDVPRDITEFKGFKEELGLDIDGISGRLDFNHCKSLTSVGVLPQKIEGNLSFYGCESLTSVGVLPEKIGGNLSFDYCKSLTSVGVLPQIIGGDLYFSACKSLTSIGVLPHTIGRYLSFYKCTSLTSVEQFPKVVKYNINTSNVPFFEDMTEEQIREKYGIKYE